MPFRFKNAILLTLSLIVVRWAAAADPFTVVALPDTQFYSSTYPATFTSQTQWIVDHVASNNIAFVAHLGDIVDRGYTTSQWNNAVAAMYKLDGKVPYGVAPGNHDLMDTGGGFTTTTFVTKFGPSHFAGRTWYGGASTSGFSSYQIVPCGGVNYLFLNLDVDAPDSQVAWAQGVIDAHPGLPTVVSTHDYLATTGRRTSPFIAGRNSGEEMWSDLIRPNDQIFMVLCGHISGQNQQVSVNNYGHKVFELLSDYQSIANGGNGFLRQLSFQPGANRIDVQTYSTTLERNLTTDDIAGFGSFTCPMDFGERFLGSAAPLASYTWATAASGNLGDVSKWAGGAVPVPGYIALRFGGATNYTVSHDLDNGPFALVCNRLEFANTSGAVTMSGASKIVLDGPAAEVGQTATGGVYLSAPLQLNAPTTNFHVLSTVFASTDISGRGNLLKTGPGTLVLSTGRLTLTGNVTVEQGAIRSGNNDALGNNTMLTLAAGATFDDSYGNGENFGGLAGNGRLLARKGDGIDFGYNNLDTLYSGIITAGTNGGVGALPSGRQITLKKSGTGMTTLTGNQSDFAGTVSILAGTLSIDNLAPRGQRCALGLGDVNNLGDADLVIETGATFRYTGASSVTDRTIALNTGGSIIDVGDPDATLTVASISGPGALTKTGAGMLRLSSVGIELPVVRVLDGSFAAPSLTTNALTVGSASAAVLTGAAISPDAACFVPEPSARRILLPGAILACFGFLMVRRMKASDRSRHIV
jgi:autotransporter-associated beta strand protein